MSDEKIIKINKFGKISKIIAKILLVFAIIGAIATTAVSIAAFCIPNDVAKVTIDGKAQVEIDEEYLEIGKKILSDVSEGMSQEGQTLNIAGSEYEYISADVDGNKININYKSPNNEIWVMNFGTFFASVSIELIIGIVLLSFVVSLCKSVQFCNSPFDNAVIDKMKKLAIAFVPWVIVKGLATSLQETAFSNKFELNLGIDISTVLIVLVFVVLITIFRYGAVLQQESDETL